MLKIINHNKPNGGIAFHMALLLIFTLISQTISRKPMEPQG